MIVVNFKGDYYHMVENGSKSSTIRNGEKGIGVGDVFIGRFHDVKFDSKMIGDTDCLVYDELDLLLCCTGVTCKFFNNLNRWDVYTEGVCWDDACKEENLLKLKKDLLGFYPTLNDGSMVYVYNFIVVGNMESVDSYFKSYGLCLL